VSVLAKNRYVVRWYSIGFFDPVLHGNLTRMIPLSKIKYTRPAALVLNDSAVFEGYAARSQLPLANLDVPETIVPEVAIWQLYERIARSEGTDPLIKGLQSLKGCDMLGQGAEATFLSSGFTVKTALAAMNPYGRDTNRIRTVLSMEIGGGWFGLDTACYNTDPWLEDLVQLQYLRLVADTVLPGFEPRRVRTRAKRDAERIRMLEKLGYTSFSFASSDIAIWIPENLLARDIVGCSKHKIEPVSPEVALRKPPADYVTAVLELLESYRHDRWLSLEELSECIDTPVRTIQRRLAEENASFTDISIRARITATTSRLRDSDQSITEIAMEMGFSSPSNFTRAFRKITGFTPSRYREIRQSDGTAAFKDRANSSGMSGP
jgi:AraC-like DNA-binding protein